VNVAIWEKAVPFQPNDLVFREGKYVACLGYVKQDFRDVIGLSLLVSSMFHSNWNSDIDYDDQAKWTQVI